MDDNQREFIRKLFAPDPEDQPATAPEQPETPSQGTISDFLHNLFHN
jgi:hypothetical protein